MGALFAKAGISIVPAWNVSSLYGRWPLDIETPKWCFALRRGIRTTVSSRDAPNIGGAAAAAGELGFDVCGVEAARGNLWCGPVDERESGWREEDGRLVTK
jgi:hypothetical protein